MWTRRNVDDALLRNVVAVAVAKISAADVRIRFAHQGHYGREEVLYPQRPGRFNL